MRMANIRWTPRVDVDLWHAIRKAEFIQGTLAIVSSIVFWSMNACREKSLLEICENVTIFVILPSAFTVVYLSRGFNLLGEKPRTGGPVIPLQRLIVRSASFLQKPPDR
jgi:hypothetical protein